MKKKRIVFVALMATSLAINIALTTLLILSRVDYEHLSTKFGVVEAERDALKAEARDASEEAEAAWWLFGYVMENFVDENKLSPSNDMSDPGFSGPDGGEVYVEKQVDAKKYPMIDPPSDRRNDY
ncbi:hypothetical protein IKW73_00620 [Candidatus Saccharibacteria bacterium]|nr:hypothetical protein [Candidatus Saccharibacteria bacterium]